MSISKKVRGILISIMCLIMALSIGAACGGNPNEDESKGVAPTVVSVPATKSVEVGTYTDFKADMDAILITDDKQYELSRVTKKPISVTIGSSVEENAEGFTSYFFDKVGEYTVKVEIKDTDGNVAYAQYKVNTLDTTAPKVTLNGFIYVWAEDGKVTLPAPEILDYSAYTTEITAKKNGADLAITDNKVDAAIGDTINVTYTVTDACENETTKEVALKVIATDKIVDAADAEVVKALTVRNGVIKVEDDAMSYFYDGKSDVIEWRDGAYAFGGAEYNALSLSIANEKSAAVKIAVYAKIGGEKKAVGSIDVAPGDGTAEAKNYTLNISGLGDAAISGWFFEMTSAANMSFSISDISLTTAEKAANTPEASDNSLIGFEDDAAFKFKKVYNGGISVNADTSFVASGAKSAKAAVKGGEYVGAIFNESYKIMSEANYVTLSAYAQVSGAIRVGLVIGGEEYTSATLALKDAGSGVNKLGFFIDATTLESFNSKAIEGIFVYNAENYDNVIYIDSVKAENKTSLLDSEVFDDGSTDYTVDKAELFTVPDLVLCDMRLISEISVCNMLGSITLADYEMGDEADLSALESGEYHLIYTAVDVFGATHSLDVTLNVTAGSLTGSVSFPNYYTNQDITLPRPTLSSDIYTAEQLADATVDIYYRIEGESEWVAVENGIMRFDEPSYIDVRYIIAKDEHRAIVMANMYIHSEGVVMDYEKHAGGDYLGYRGIMYNSGTNTPSISTRWSKDGKYSLYVQHFATWDDYNGVWETRYTLSELCDTVVFWAYSDWEPKKAKILFDDFSDTSPQRSTRSPWGDVKIMPGEHKYVSVLSEAIDRFDRWWINVDKMHGFYVDNFYLYKSADYEWQKIDGNRYNEADGAISFEKPKVTNVNTKLFTAEEIENIKYYVDITEKATTIKKTYEITGEKIDLSLAKGEYTVKYRVVIGGTEYSDVQEISVTDLACAFVKPLTTIDANKDYNFALPEADSGAEVRAYYMAVGANDWTELDYDADSENAVVNIADPGKYLVKFTVEKDGLSDEETYNLTVRDKTVIADFELQEDGSHHGMYGAERVTAGYLSDWWAADGDYSFYINSGSHNIYEWRPTTALTFDRKYNAIKMDAKVIRNPVRGSSNLGAVLNGLEILLTATKDGATVNLTSEQVYMPQGENSFIYVFNDSFDGISLLSFYVHYLWVSSFYIDNFTLVNVDLPDLATDSFYKIGDDITIEAASTEVEGVTTQVRYGLVGGESEYVTESDGTFTVSFDTNGEYEIVTEVILGGNPFITRTTIVMVRAFGIEFVEPISTLSMNKEYTFAIYETAEEDTAAKAYLRKAGETDWDEIPMNADNKTFKLTLEEAGEYELKYEATKGDLTETVFHNLRTRDDNILIDFEKTEEDGYFGMGPSTNSPNKLSDSCYITDEWAADGEYSYFFGYKGVSSIGISFYDESKYNAANGYLRDRYVDLGERYNAITLTINAKRIIYGYGKDTGGGVYEVGDGMKLYLIINDANGAIRTIESLPQIIPVGTGTYTFIFEEDFERVYGLGTYLHYWMSTDFYIDAIKVERIEYPVVPSIVQVGDTITVEAAKLNDALTTTVRYSVNGGAYVNLGTVKDKCEIQANEMGYIDIEITVKYNGVLIKTITKRVNVSYDPFAPDIPWED